MCILDTAPVQGHETLGVGCFWVEKLFWGEVVEPIRHVDDFTLLEEDPYRIGWHTYLDVCVFHGRDLKDHVIEDFADRDSIAAKSKRLVDDGIEQGKLMSHESQMCEHG
jgi:hypothetical protein